MFFLSFANVKVKFAELRKLIQRFYTISETLPTTSLLKLINFRKFPKVALYESSKTFEIYISILEAIIIHLFWIAQITT